MPAPRPKKISEFKPTFSNLAQTSHYQLIFGGLSSDLRSHLSRRGVDSRFIADTVGLLCSSASLPGSSIGTADIAGNFMGVAEKMAHSRIFTQIDLEFYVDSDYKTMKFLEHWVEFIASGSGENQASEGYYFRMRYPEEYKCNQTKIIKFDRDYKKYIEYTFFGMFPIAFNSTAVSYSGSDILKASASFNFDRYVSGSVRSVDIKRGSDNNKDSLNENMLNNPFGSLPTNSENLSYSNVVIDKNPLAETKVSLESGFNFSGDVSSYYPK